MTKPKTTSTRETAISTPSRLAGAHTARHPGVAGYDLAWRNIASGTIQGSADGNRMLLENEQFSIIQPRYDTIMANETELIGAGVFGFARASAFTANSHPYHRDFITAFPTGDVRIADARWKWIDAPQLTAQRQICGESHEVDVEGHVRGSATASTNSVAPCRASPRSRCTSASTTVHPSRWRRLRRLRRSSFSKT